MSHHRPLLLACAALALVACRDPSPAAPVEAPSPAPVPAVPAVISATPGGIRATLTLSRARVKHASDLEIRVTLTNGGTEPYPYSTWFLAVPSLRLQVRDLAGKRVPPGPPPVPREWDPAERHVIPPGGTFELTFSGSSYFMAEPPPGLYEIRFEHSLPRAEGKDAPVETPWVKFEVTP